MLNIISIIIYVLTTILSLYIVIRYRFIDVEVSEGSGIVVFAFHLFNTSEIVILLGLNLIGIIIASIGRNLLQYKQQMIWRGISIIVPILTYMIQIMITGWVS